MKNLETLLSLIVGLLYWIFKTYQAHQRATEAPKSEPEMWTEPSANKYPLPTTRPTLPHLYPMLPFQTIPNKGKQKITNKSIPIPSQSSRKTVPTNTLERKLTRYNSLQKSILIHEILQPKYF
jgi:hypothetical protein